MENIPHPLALPEGHPQRHHHRVLVTLIVATTIALGALGYLYWNLGLASVPVGTSGPSGTLYFSLAPGGLQVADAYTLDLATGEMRLLRDDLYYKLTPTVSRDGTQMAFVGRFKTDATNERDIFVARQDGSEPFRITSAEHYLERLPVWSPDGHRIAFTASAVPEPQTLNGWSIYTVDDKTNAEIRVSSGAWPQFLPSGQLLGMREDGIYLFDLQNKTADKVWHFGEKADIGMKLALSPDGRHLAWLVPGAGETYLFEITSLEPFELNVVKVIPSQSMWAAFSPDSAYLALQEVEWDNTPRVTKNVLAIYDIARNEKTRVVDITGFNPELVLLSDWR